MLQQAVLHYTLTMSRCCILHCCCFPQVVWDCREGRERSGSHAGGSLRNSAEANLAATLVHGAFSAKRLALAGWLAHSQNGSVYLCSSVVNGAGADHAG
jgi:hypothetical protein